MSGRDQPVMPEMRVNGGSADNARAAAYQQDGYVIVRSLFSEERIETVRAEILALANAERDSLHGSRGQPGRTVQEVLDGILAIHFPHKASSLILSIMKEPAIADVLAELIGPDVKCLQSMLFVKKAGKPGQAWHQDEHFIPTRDRSLCGVWIALDRATPENGCLWVHPGSHAPGVIYPTRAHDDDRFDTSAEAFGFPYEREGGVPVELEAGDAVFFNGYLLHRSLRNISKKSYRRALVFHYLSARSLLPFSMGTEQADPKDFRDVVMVRGADPYAWKGFEDILVPFVRPADEEESRQTHERIWSAMTEKAKQSTADAKARLAKAQDRHDEG